MKSLRITCTALCCSIASHAAEIHVSAQFGRDSNSGAQATPLKTIQAAANAAQPGDTVIVHAGIYRERVNPPRGGTSDQMRIIYMAAPGEKVVITGAEPAKGWTKVENDTWKVVIPTRKFGAFNPYADLIRGDWMAGNGPVHTGCVYLNDEWLLETTSFDEVKKPAGATPRWFAQVDGVTGQGLTNLAWFRVGGGKRIPAGTPDFRYGGQPAPCSEGGTCSGFNVNGCWLRFDGVDFGESATSVALRTASPGGPTHIELHMDGPDGELLGSCIAGGTGGWQNWKTGQVNIKPVSGKKNLCLVLKGPGVNEGNTTIYAQFPKGVDPDKSMVDVNARQTVFYPARTGINYITVRGFTLEKAAANGAPPSSEQKAIIGTNWSKGWVIENNVIRFSVCSGVSLGKYGDGTDNTNTAGAADPYTDCVRRALASGWSKEKIGSHTVRRNTISHCGQTAIVGSMGAAFSLIEGNDIHDIDARGLFRGAELAGIKFHAPVDSIIRDNHIHHCRGGSAGIWLDWMTQGTRVTGNLMHDNHTGFGDIFLEVNQGPYVLDNNILLSGLSLGNQSRNGAFVHNLFGGDFVSGHETVPGRRTPVLVPNGTAFAVDPPPVSTVGDDRLCNNLFAGGNGMASYNWTDKLALAVGNLNLSPAAAWKSDSAPSTVAAPSGLRLETREDGVYLTLNTPPLPVGFRAAPVVTTELLGEAVSSKQRYTNPDGTPMVFDADYFGKPRNPKNPFPGPFEIVAGGQQTIKVWPKP